MTYTPDERRHIYHHARTLGTLSQRELQVLHYWATGIGIRKTATTLELSEWTVRTFRDRALRKVELSVKVAA